MSVDIHDNDTLASLTGLEGITRFRYLSVVGNASLTSLAGLYGTAGAGPLLANFVQVTENPKLASLAGLRVVPDELSGSGMALTVTTHPVLRSARSTAWPRSWGATVPSRRRATTSRRAVSKETDESRESGCRRVREAASIVEVPSCVTPA